MRSLVLLPLLASAGAQTQFRSHEALKDAVNQWCVNSSLAQATFGDINTWDVTRVSNMRLLFNDKYDFNDDISGWDVSHVTTMVGGKP